MNWGIEEAQQKFTELITAATNEPQLIYNQEQLVVAVVEAEVFQEFLAWRKQQQKLFLADAFTELRQLCIEEDYIFEIPSRQDRPNAFTETVDELSL